MAKAKRGLGRGLDSLFEDTTPGSEGGQVSSLPLRDIEPDRDQPRKNFEDESLGELCDSIRQHGLLQPIAVRGGEALAGGPYGGPFRGAGGHPGCE